VLSTDVCVLEVQQTVNQRAAWHITTEVRHQFGKIIHPSDVPGVRIADDFKSLLLIALNNQISCIFISVIVPWTFRVTCAATRVLHLALIKMQRQPIRRQISQYMHESKELVDAIAIWKSVNLA
jgi:hypothetical protein